MKICICGDSWACGEWGNINPEGQPGLYGLRHSGLEFFLSQHHTVTNVGRGASSNTDTVAALKQALSESQFDYIFLFQTDPLRSLRPYIKFFRVTNLTFDQLLEENYNQTKIFYEAINQLNHKIHCIGGCSKLDTALMQNYSNLVPYIPAVTEWLEPSYQHPEIWHSDWLGLVDKQFELKCLDRMLACKKKQDDLREYKTYFFPDGCHLNRQGHEMLSEKIKKDFGL